MFKSALTKRAKRFAVGTASGLATLFAVGSSANACPTDPYLASVCTTVANFCPRGYAEMRGQLMTISDNNALFSLLGCSWGGDCRTSFGIPDMRGRAGVGAGTGPGLTPIALGQWRGQEDVTLDVSQLPAHTHASEASISSLSVSLEAYDGNGTSPTPSNDKNYLQAVGENPFVPNATANLYGEGTGTPVELGGVDASSGTIDVSIGTTGSNVPVDVQGPVMAVTYCIATTGIYPPRT